MQQDILDEAKRILESEAFRKAVEAVERHFIEEAARAEVNDDPRIIENMRHVRALRAVVAGLESWAMTGKIRANEAEKSKHGDNLNVA